MAALGSRHPWETEDLPGPEPEVDPEFAGGELVAVLLSLLYSRAISARSFCILCWWAWHAGATGEVRKYARKPGLQSGKYQRHLDTINNFKNLKRDLYFLNVPLFSKHDEARTVRPLGVAAPHELLHREALVSDDLGTLLEESLASNEWGEAYRTNPIVTESSVPVHPLALYCDGIPYSNHDGAIAFYVYSLVSQTRHLCCIVRRSVLCACGCRGWCTFFCIFQFLHWSLRALARGTFPLLSHDNAPWDAENNSSRASLAGRPLRLRGMLLHIKGDWSEWAHTFGFMSWKSGVAPCLLCDATPDNMFNVETFTVLDSPFNDTTQDQYEAECRKCEQWRWVTAENFRQIQDVLFFDQRPQGGRGRCVKFAVPCVDLRANDRLEPHSGMPDVMAFDSLALPAWVLFWRSTADIEPRLHHRNPLFDGSLGISVQCFAVDTLHALFLGVVGEFVKVVLWTLLRAGAWCAVGGRGDEELAHLSLARLRAQLFAWYESFQRQHPECGVTRVGNLTLGMLGGPRGDSAVTTKGAETKWLLYFSLDMLASHASLLPTALHSSMSSAGHALRRHVEVHRDAPRQLSRKQTQESVRRIVPSLWFHSLVSPPATTPSSALVSRFVLSTVPTVRDRELGVGRHLCAARHVGEDLHGARAQTPLVDAHGSRRQGQPEVPGNLARRGRQSSPEAAVLPRSPDAV